MTGTTERTLTPAQTRAAELIGGRGWQQKDAAEEVGVTPKSVQRWMQLPEFERLVRQRREAQLAESPSTRDVLESAMSATRKDGSEDWQTRLKAVELLVKSEPKEAAPNGDGQRETRIYLPPDAPEEDADGTRD